mgnify:FL=1
MCDLDGGVLIDLVGGYCTREGDHLCTRGPNRPHQGRSINEFVEHCY